MSIALLVNAGGLSRRMGRVKALLPVPPDDTPLIVHVVRQLAPLANERIVVVCNEPLVAASVQMLDRVLVLPDRWPNGGALGGIATALVACTGWAMVVACDMPMVSRDIFGKLIEIAHADPTLDAVVPFVAGQGQPFHALWHRRALPILEARLEAGEFGVQATLAALHVAWVDASTLGIEADTMAFGNVNTPQEWSEFLVFWAEQNRPIT